MSVTTLTPITMTLDTVGDDLPDASGTVATTPSDGWSCDVTGYKANRILFKFLADPTGDTVVINAGDYPPAARSGLGSLSLVLAANDVRHIVIEAARFMQNDGTITAYCADAGTMAWCFILPLNV
jgi:hypothetical protein